MAIEVLILAGDTDGNLGDLAIVTATCDAIRSADADATISLLTSSPARDVSRLNITPIRRGLRGLLGLAKAANRADLTICGGGGLFQDDDSLAKMPYWAIRLMFVRLFATSIHGLSIGAGPLNHRFSRFFAWLALKQMVTVSVRDELAKTALQPLTGKSVTVIPDPAFCLQATSQADAEQTLAASGVPLDGRPVLGVAVRRWFHKHSSVIPYKYAVRLGLNKHRGKEKMQSFIRLLSLSLERVTERTGAHILFLPTYNVEHEADQDVCNQVAALLKPGTHSTLQLSDPRRYKSICGLATAMICGRMHPGILAAGQGTPILGLEYNQKFTGVFSLLSRKDSCISMAEFVDDDRSAWLTERLVAMIEQPATSRPDTTNLEMLTRNYIVQLAVQAATPS